MSKPKVVLISDLHFTPATLHQATASLLAAMARARCLNVALIIAGDTLDSKDIIRGSCANRLISLLADANDIAIYLMVGNHDLLNEKSTEHSLNFLKPYVNVIDSPEYITALDLYLIPYQTDSAELKTTLSHIESGATLIMHQGVQTANMGHYVQDKTSLPPEAFADFRVISGHYHRRQDIKCGRPRKGAIGLFSYIGNPYSLSFGEAQDGNKGFQVLMDDGILEFQALNLRKHVVIETSTKFWRDIERPNPEDLVWLKIEGPRSQLAEIKKSEVAKFIGHSNFKLDLIPTDTSAKVQEAQKLSGEDLFDSLITGLDGEDEDYKNYLKLLWREVLS